jgi:thioredoxin-related protein
MVKNQGICVIEYISNQRYHDGQKEGKRKKKKKTKTKTQNGGK